MIKGPTELHWQFMKQNQNSFETPLKLILPQFPSLPPSICRLPFVNGGVSASLILSSRMENTENKFFRNKQLSSLGL